MSTPTNRAQKAPAHENKHKTTLWRVEVTAELKNMPNPADNRKEYLEFYAVVASKLQGNKIIGVCKDKECLLQDPKDIGSNLIIKGGNCEVDPQSKSNEVIAKFDIVKVKLDEKGNLTREPIVIRHGFQPTPPDVEFHPNILNNYEFEDFYEPLGNGAQFSYYVGVKEDRQGLCYELLPNDWVEECNCDLGESEKQRKADNATA